jgi:hypothetical protein
MKVLLRKSVCLFVLFPMLLFAEHGGDELDEHVSDSYVIDTEQYVFDTEGKNLCGVNALYLALKFLGKGKPYAELILNFPSVRENGLTMRQMEAYLIQEGFYCKILRITRAELFSLKKGLGLFVFEKNQNQTNEDFSHVYFANLLPEEKIQVFDFPKFSGKIKKEDMKEQNVVCLLAAKTVEELPDTWNTFPLWVCLFLMFLTIYAYTLFRAKYPQTTPVK